MFGKLLRWRHGTEEEIEHLLDGYQESGMRRREYFGRVGIPVTSLDYYRQRRRVKATQRLVKVRVKTAGGEPEGVFTLVLANGWRIESGWKFGEAELARLIRIAEAV